jgi:16S rRNA (uracil1498-N3)-methyltransferase
MHRFYVPSPSVQNKQLSLSGEEWHHCQNVVRLRQGDRASLFDGRGSEYLVQLSVSTAEAGNFKVLSQQKTAPPPHLITLIQALPKNKAMDYIIQKATELGVRKIIPVVSERSVIRIGEDDEGEAKVERWNEIAIEAAKQCGLNWLPRIDIPVSVKVCLEGLSIAGLRFIGSLQPDSKPLWAHIPNEGVDQQKEITIMIGPEGDFTPAELGLAKGAGFLPLSLGPLVLRCDTAAIYAVSTLSYELSRLSGLLARKTN